MIKEFSVIKSSSGAYIVSAIVNGYREEQVYMGFTKRESLIMFRDTYLRKG